MSWFFENFIEKIEVIFHFYQIIFISKNIFWTKNEGKNEENKEWSVWNGNFHEYLIISPHLSPHLSPSFYHLILSPHLSPSFYHLIYHLIFTYFTCIQNFEISSKNQFFQPLKKRWKWGDFNHELNPQIDFYLSHKYDL